jgi:hypothetical protein
VGPAPPTAGVPEAPTRDLFLLLPEIACPLLYFSPRPTDRSPELYLHGFLRYVSDDGLEREVLVLLFSQVMNRNKPLRGLQTTTLPYDDPWGKIQRGKWVSSLSLDTASSLPSQPSRSTTPDMLPLTFHSYARRQIFSYTSMKYASNSVTGVTFPRPESAMNAFRQHHSEAIPTPITGLNFPGGVT